MYCLSNFFEYLLIFQAKNPSVLNCLICWKIKQKLKMIVFPDHNGSETEQNCLKSDSLIRI